MTAKRQGQKGNPAAKRMGNAARGLRRSRCWARGEKRHVANREANDRRAKANRDSAREDPGYLTPWARARHERAARRDADPQIIARRKEIARARKAH